MAAELGISEAAVRRARRQFGIESHANPKSTYQQGVEGLAERVRGLAGKATSPEIEARLDIKLSTVDYIRRRYDIHDRAAGRTALSRPMPPGCHDPRLRVSHEPPERLERMLALMERIGTLRH